MYPPLPCRWTSLFHLLIAGKGVNDWITLAVPAESVMLFNPMTGEKGKAQTRKQEGKTQVRLQLHSGESVILQTFNHALTDVAEWKYVQEQPVSLSLDHGWKLHLQKHSRDRRYI